MELFDHYINRWFSCSKIWGVHLSENSKGDFEGYAILLNNNKNTLQIEQLFEISALDTLSNDIFKNVPISLSIDSNSVLDRNIEEYNEESLSEFFHISNSNEFSVQVIQLLKEQNVQVIRTGLLHQLIANIKNQKIELVSVTLGAVNFLSGAGYVLVNNIEKPLQFNNYTIIGKGNNVERIIKSDLEIENKEPIRLGNDTITNDYVLPYCNALSIFLHVGTSSYILHEVFPQEYSEYTYSKFYKLVLPICLALLLVLLLGNFAVLQHYTKKQAKLSGEYASHQMLYNKIKKTGKSVSGSKENFWSDRYGWRR